MTDNTLNLEQMATMLFYAGIVLSTFALSAMIKYRRLAA
jgi:hypothetical protein